MRLERTAKKQRDGEGRGERGKLNTLSLQVSHRVQGRLSARVGNELSLHQASQQRRSRQTRARLRPRLPLLLLPVAPHFLPVPHPHVSLACERVGVAGLGAMSLVMHALHIPHRARSPRPPIPRLLLRCCRRLFRQRKQLLHHRVLPCSLPRLSSALLLLSHLTAPHDPLLRPFQRVFADMRLSFCPPLTMEEVRIHDGSALSQT
mmetsp:Transcript_21168/g.47676  ORF Transcript_21168/g.47676 Transcript_21168/m.47676 type:complete len:205 (+) Transcript_21168:950-1564(+)